MPDWFIMLLPKLTTAMFIFAVGACVGSLINVLVYRLPLGLDVVRPTSRCPGCSTKLTWRENIPIFGWLLLRGRCRFCQCKISPEYPIVEFFTAVVFCLFYVLWYVVDPSDSWLGIHWGAAAPEWAHNGPINTWPIFVVLLILMGCLIAMTIVDAKTFTIPLVLAWVPAIAAVLILPAHAAWFEMKFGALAELSPGYWVGEGGRHAWKSADDWLWSLPSPMSGDLSMIGAAIGATVGLGVSMLLLKLGLIRRSFDDYEQWEKAELARLQAERDQNPEGDSQEQPDDPHESELWIQYPHARREMFKEIAYLGAPAGGAWLGAWIAGDGAGWFTGVAPLWLTVLSGVLLGYLIGGAVVWGVRILGSLAFGKEAMGLGDVHLMAAVGACLGWIDPVIAFFMAAFLGTGWEVARRIVGGKLNKALPYGPHLAAATALVVLLKPLVELGLSQMFATPVDLP